MKEFHREARRCGFVKVTRKSGDVHVASCPPLLKIRSMDCEVLQNKLSGSEGIMVAGPNLRDFEITRRWRASIALVG